MNSLLLALQFLTRIPIPVKTEFNEIEAGKSLFWFPWIAFVLGAIVCAVDNFFYDAGPIFSAFCGLASWYLLNGGLHVDGLMDTADGFLSNRDRKRVVEIMHDSTIGAFAVLSLVFVLLGKFSVLATVAIQPVELGILLASARMGLLTGIHFFPSAEGSSMGNIFKKRASKKSFCLQWPILAVGILLTEGAAYLLFPIVACLYGGLFAQWSVKKIGGLTGDVYGAIVETGELLMLLLFGGLTSWAFI
ncbi:MAG: adenosylcobinamide-GDP ribazoletransferase [Peptoniphilus sp.]|nr:adenosylcobinamide-GDP ribazoletransferase [Peptoniphilus sp.]MDY3118590.1 adenosylcobinamide-GDP ribazoletransferase [Peptoniphilus sp.]